MNQEFSSCPEIKQEGKMEVQTLEYLQEERSFFGKMESIFHNFLRALFDRKSKNNKHKL